MSKRATVTLLPFVFALGCPGGGDDPVPAAQDAPATPPPAVIEAAALESDDEAKLAPVETKAKLADDDAPDEQGGA